MSDSNLSRRTKVETSFGGTDITSSIAPYFLSMSYTDNEEDEADDLQIKLQDRDSIWMEQWLEQIVEKASESSGGAAAGATSASSDHSMLSTGSTGGEVRTLQSMLVSLAYSLPVYGEDGIFGGETAAAVRAFQSDHGLDPDGICGPLTWAALEEAAGAAAEAESGGAAEGMQIGAVIVRENWEGDGADEILPCGSFEPDRIVASGPPAVIMIESTSLSYTAQIRQTRKSRAWESYNLSGIASEIAVAHGMVCMYESASDPFYSRVEQLKTSDIHFLETLCHNAGISLKATYHILVLFDQVAYESKDAVVTIKKGGGAYTKYNLNVGTADTQYSSCRVSYVDGTGKCIEGIAKVEDYDATATNNQQLEITAKVESAGEAKVLAEKLLRKHNRYARTATFTMPGNPNLVAGVTVMLEGWGLWDGKYIIRQAKHTVDRSGGYTVKVKLRRVLEGY